MKFVISKQEKLQRRKNVLWGLVLSLTLATAVGFLHYRYPEKYNSFLFWSVVGFLILANAVNYVRHLRYLRTTEKHYLELLPGRLRFSSGEAQVSELDLQQVAALRFFRKHDRLRHIQLLLKTNRGIRLEGYQDLDTLAKLLSEQIPAAKIIGK